MSNSDLHAIGLLAERTRQSLRLARRLERLTGWSWRLGLTVLILFVVDGRWPLPAAVRTVAAAGLAAGLILTLWQLRLPRGLRRATSMYLIRHVEVAGRIVGNPIVAAMQLRTLALEGPVQRLDTCLAHRALERGERLAREYQTRSTVDFTPAARQGRRLAVVGTVAILVAVLCPRLLSQELVRFVDPLGDHPPFTWLDFAIELRPGADDVLVGDDVHVTVSIVGPEVHQVDLVRVWTDEAVGGGGGGDRSQEEPTPIPMTPVRAEAPTGPEGEAHSDARRYQAVLRSVREPLLIFVRTEQGRSDSIRINPLDLPRLTGFRIVAHTPEYAQRPPVVITDLSEPTGVHLGGAVEVELFATNPFAEVDVTTHREGEIASGDALSDESSSKSEALVTHLPDGRNAMVRFTVTELGSNRHTLRLVNQAGRFSRESVSLTIRGIEDAPPRIEFRTPGADAAALADQTVPLEIIAGDDLGLGLVELHRTVERAGRQSPGAGSEILANFPAPGPTLTRARYNLDLSPLELQPGDVVRYWATVGDVRPESYGGPQSTLSPVYEILIIDKQTLETLVAERRRSEPDPAARPYDDEGEAPIVNDDGGGGDGERSSEPLGDRADEAPGRSDENSEAAPGDPVSDSITANQDSQIEDAGNPGRGSSSSGQPSRSPPDGGASPGAGDDPDNGPGSGSGQNQDQSRAEPATDSAGQSGQEAGLLARARGRIIFGDDDLLDGADARQQHAASASPATDPPDDDIYPLITQSLPTIKADSPRRTTHDLSSDFVEAGSIGAVPLPYRELAGRYFQRLADDAAANRPPTRRENQR